MATSVAKWPDCIPGNAHSPEAKAQLIMFSSGDFVVALYLEHLPEDWQGGELTVFSDCPAPWAIWIGNFRGFHSYEVWQLGKLSDLFGRANRSKY